MKFSEMQYVRPDINEIKKRIKNITEEFNVAETYDDAKKAFLANQDLAKNWSTLSTLVTIRNSIDTRDKFYDEEVKFMNKSMPEIDEYFKLFTSVMLKSKFRKDFEKEYGNFMFINAEIELKTFKPEIIPDLQKEIELTTEYEKLLASSQINFKGKTYTLSQMTPFMEDLDDVVRLEAWKATGQWFKDNQEKFDEYYDELTHLRDNMGKKLGYDGYTQLGYYRMWRNCYTKEDIEKFRKSVVKYIVPVADSIYRKQAKRIGKTYPMNYADNNLEFRSGNPKPCGTAGDILMQGRKFYDELSPETSEFFRTMLDNELLDVLSTTGKQTGGYCTNIYNYKVPFIFANFNGTKGDVDVITHEAGHAFAFWMNRNRIPVEYCSPSSEACEVHSMSMEFLSDPWAEVFFGSDAKKFLYSQLADAIKFIPYGTMVDHFQHVIYEKPYMTPAERHSEWKKLTEIYMPWVRLDGEIPFFSDGKAWQRQHHIYSFPFYYIDYCLAQTVALEIWALMQDDFKNAFNHYMAFLKQGGSRTFVDLLKNANLDSPFDEKCLKNVLEIAEKWLDSFDISGVK